MAKKLSEYTTQELKTERDALSEKALKECTFIHKNRRYVAISNELWFRSFGTKAPHI